MSAKRSLFAISGFLLSLLLIGCAAPGSALTRPSVRGRLVDARGHGIQNRRIDLMLPSQYGLSGLDAVWGKPEDYGHKQQVATVQTDSDGRFSHFPTDYLQHHILSLSAARRNSEAASETILCLAHSLNSA